jgi:PhnB protein
MTEASKGVPAGASAIIPRLFCRDPAAEIDFCTTTFRATEVVRRNGADGTLAHALITIGPAMVMIEAEWPQITNRAPVPDGSSPVALYVYIDDVDEAVKRAAAAGARVLMAPADQFWGDRTGWVMDPAGHVWTIASRIEESTEAQRQQRLARLHAEQRDGPPPGAQ